MDYTKIPEPLVYRKKSLDKLTGLHPLNAALIKQLMKMESWEEKNPDYVITPCLNTAYYICTIMRMESDATYRTPSYFIIAKGRGKFDARMQCVTLSIVALLIEHSTPHWHQKLQEVADDLRERAGDLKQIEEYELLAAPGTKYTNVIELLGIPKFLKNCMDDSWVLPDELFQPRVIDEKALDDLLRLDKSFNWDKFLYLLDDDEIRELIAELGKTQHEKATLIGAIWKDMCSVHKEIGISLQPTRILLNGIAHEFCPDYIEATGLPQDDSKAMDNEDSDTSKYEARIKKLEEELEAYKEKKKGINQHLTALFGLKLAELLGITYTNKKSLAPVLSKLFGWGTRKLEQELCKYFSNEDDLELANIFGKLSPDVAKKICKNWKDKKSSENANSSD